MLTETRDRRAMSWQNGPSMALRARIWVCWECVEGSRRRSASQLLGETCCGCCGRGLAGRTWRDDAVPSQRCDATAEPCLHRLLQSSPCAECSRLTGWLVSWLKRRSEDSRAPGSKLGRCLKEHRWRARHPNTAQREPQDSQKKPARPPRAPPRQQPHEV